MTCNKCKIDVPEGAKFCPNCGKKVYRPKPKSDVPILPDEVNKVVIQFPPVINVKECAQLLRVSNSLVYELVYQNKIPHFRLQTKGKQKPIRFDTKEVLDWAKGLNGPITTAG